MRTAWMPLLPVLLVIGAAGAGDDAATHSASPPVTTRAAATRPADIPSPIVKFQNSELKVSDVVASAKPTAAQQAGVRAVLEQEGLRWMEWHRTNRQHATEVDAGLTAAVEAKDETRLRELYEQWEQTKQTMPRSENAWEKIRALFDADRQRGLESLDRKGREAVGHELHRYFIVRDASSSMDGCYVCHMKHHSISRR